MTMRQSGNPIKHIVVCSKDSRDISDRIYDMSSTRASISEDIMALLNIKVDDTNIHSVHLRDHQVDSPIPSLEYMTLSNDARKALTKAETRMGSGNNVDQHGRALLSRWACSIDSCGMTWYRSLAGDQEWQAHCMVEHDGFNKLVCPLAACRSRVFRDYKGVVEHIENVHIAALGLRDHYRSSHDRDRTLSDFRCTEDISKCGNTRCSYTNQLALDTHVEFFHPYSAWKDRLKDFPSLVEQIQSKWSTENLEPYDGITLSEAFQCIDATVGSQGTVIVGQNEINQDTFHGMESLEKSWPFMADFLRATQEPLRAGFQILSCKI
ncbi:hypothetical protein BOTCAL_0013g00550 [Botryotinia calthae]|uniref:Uncharacterized protein n=1 Tax=Botryotinia calthae TaxID=38488 RepID=A0A4Y8DIA1_9HELO|nr:hypothetical protein BOTCAL_0013g00550 [Botryotinia calthae]